MGMAFCHFEVLFLFVAHHLYTSAVAAGAAGVLGLYFIFLP